MVDIFFFFLQAFLQARHLNLADVCFAFTDLAGEKKKREREAGGRHCSGGKKKEKKKIPLFTNPAALKGKFSFVYVRVFREG